MSPDATTVMEARRSDDPSEVAFDLLYAATHVIGDEYIAKVFLARLMLKIAGELDPDVLRSSTTQ